MDTHLYFAKMFDTSHACLKVLNANGQELSLSGDDSCGAVKRLFRTEMVVFKDRESSETITPTVYHVSPEELLEALAAHLGYHVCKDAEDEN